MADFPIDVTVDPRPAERGLQRVENRLSRVDNAAVNVGRSLVRAFAGIAAGIGGAGAIRTLASYETQMAAVRAITGATESQFTSLRAEAVRLGTTTEFSARQAGSGMEFLARAGFDTTQVLQATAGALTLATAGAVDLGRAADITSNVLSGFGFEVDQVNRVNDVLAAISTRTNTSIEGLGQSFSFIAPIAAAAGVRFEQVGAALGILGNAGIQGTRAATGLQAAMRGLVSDTGPARDILASLGITAEQLDPQIHGLLEPLRLLASRNLTLQETLRLFGDEGAAAFAALARGVSQVESLEEALGDVEGEGERLAGVMRNQLGGAFRGLGSAIEGLIIQVGEQGLIGATRTTVDALTALFRSLAEDGGRVRRIIDSIIFALGILLVRAISIQLVAAVGALQAAITSLTWSNFLTASLQVIFLVGTAIYAFANTANETFRRVILSIGRFLDTVLNSILAVTSAIDAFFFGLDRRVADVARRLGAFFYNNLVEALNRIPGINLQPIEVLGSAIGTTLGEGVIEAFEAQLGRTRISDFLGRRFTFPVTDAADTRFRPRTADRITPDPDESRIPITDEEDALNQRKLTTLIDIFDTLRQERALITLNADARDRRVRILQIEAMLERELSPIEEESVERLLRENQALERRQGILNQIRGGEADFRAQLEQVNILLAEGANALGLTNEQMQRLLDLRRDLVVSLGEGSFLEILDQQLDQTFGKLDNLATTIAERITSVIGKVSEGIATTFTNILAGTTSVGDAIRNLAFSAVQALTQQLFQAVVQALLLKTIFAAFGVGPGGGSFGALFLDSLFGRDGGLVANLPRFQGGGMVYGPGGPREDQVIARLSPGEFIVNERATRRNRSDLEAINEGRERERERRPTVIFNQTVMTPDADSFRRSRQQVARTYGRAIQTAAERA